MMCDLAKIATSVCASGVLLKRGCWTQQQCK